MLKRITPFLFLLALAGCPEPLPGPYSSQAGGQQPQPGKTTDEPGTPAPPPLDPTRPEREPPVLPPWELIKKPMVEEIAWPMLDPVAEWPAPDSLVDPEKSPVARAFDLEEVKQLAFVVERALERAYRPSDPRAAAGVDAQGRLFLKLGRGKTEGSASFATHPADRPPTFAFALETGKPAATTIEELRAQVAAVVSEPLAEEMKKEKHRLEPHPKGLPGVGLAFLDRNGFGQRFPYLYAYSSKGKLLVLMHEVPSIQLPEQPR